MKRLTCLIPLVLLIFTFMVGSVSYQSFRESSDSVASTSVEADINGETYSDRSLSDALSSHISVMERITGEPLSRGNKVSLLVNGPAAFAAMIRAIEQARDHVNVEFYIIKDDEIGKRFAKIFLEKQAAGIQVNVIYDSLGSKETSKEFFQKLEDGGVNIVKFNPPGKTNGDITVRDHRKLLIVDGSVAYTGGINIGDDYAKHPSENRTSGTGNEEVAWRDTVVQIEGPVVAQFQRLFLDSWRSQHGPHLAGQNYFPLLPEAGSDMVMAVGSTAREKGRAAYAMYLSAFDAARRSIYITNAYFIPDVRIVESLKRAAGRGVDVRLILPAESDHFLVLKAGKASYGTLLTSGIRIYEFRTSLLHAKTAVIDGVWSTVGSTNMEPWSFKNNEEINALVLSERFGSEMERQFGEDLRQSDEVTLERRAGEPYWYRMIEAVVGLLFRIFH